MAIVPVCDMCKRELNEYGALLFSPPEKNMVKKMHLCRDCYNKIVKIISQSF